MLWSLIKKECSQIVRSFSFYLYLIIFILFVTSQFGDIPHLQKPVPGLKDYGTTSSKDPEVIMKDGLNNLFLELCNNKFATYPFMIIKNVNLDKQDLERAKEYFKDCTGVEFDQARADETYQVKVKKDLEYSHFLNDMKQLCKLIGSGSYYEKDNLENRVERPMTYKEALKEYEDICRIDHITNAYNRVFCDYVGIILAILPMLLGVTRAVRDRRSNAIEIIYAKQISAARLLLSRYLANVIMTMIPVYVVGILAQLPIVFDAKVANLSVSYVTLIKDMTIWLLPEIMVVLACSSLLTELFGGLLAIIGQTVWTISSLASSMTLMGHFGYHLIIRWNQVGSSRLFLQTRTQLYQNRGFFFVFSILLLAANIAIYEYKRRRGGVLLG
ncbi:hypothetical protein lbkm_0468 [Lachnospiraceae bacterium KM106-2]|nr:hypothetical protein lbkm_0468 [Lachnospiraceae bacterium KM106-2]